MKTIRAAMLVVVVASSGWLLAAPAGAVTVLCGQTITESIKVSNNLIECLQSGLIVGAPDITIDLNGKTIDGNHTDDSPGGTDAGIDINGQSGVTIKNGTIRHFEIGVFDDATGGTTRVTRARVIDNTLDGIRLDGATNTVTSSTVTKNHINGILLTAATGHTVTANTVSGNHGVGISASGTGNRVTRNVVKDNVAVLAFVVVDGAGSTVTGNTLTGNTGGISVMGDNNVVSGNSITRNSTFSGPTLAVNGATTSIRNNLLDQNGGGLAVFGTSSTVTGNIIKRIPLGVSIIISTPALQLEGTGHTVTRNKILSNNGGNTILLIPGPAVTFGPATNTITFERNVVNGNTGDGVTVSGTNHTVRNNVANRNGFKSRSDPGDNFGLGIDAGAAITPTFAGNRAKGNDHPDQCLPEGACN